MSIILLPSRSPQLNPVENVWQYLRANWLSNRVFESYDDILDAGCNAWKHIIDRPDVIRSIKMRKGAHGISDQYFLPLVQRALLPVRGAIQLCPDLYQRYRPIAWAEDIGDLSRALRFDTTAWLPGTLLERGDRMTRAASIEARTPFMDTRLCYYVATLERRAFPNCRAGKWTLRRATADLRPPEILKRPRAGFRVPVHEWLRGRLQAFA